MHFHNNCHNLFGKRKECCKSWYTIQADFRHFIIYDCHDICSLAEAGKILQGNSKFYQLKICIRSAVIKGPAGRKKS